MPPNSTWPALEERTRQGFFTPSNANASVPRSPHQKASSKRSRGRACRNRRAASGSRLGRGGGQGGGSAGPRRPTTRREAGGPRSVCLRHEGCGALVPWTSHLLAVDACVSLWCMGRAVRANRSKVGTPLPTWMGGGGHGWSVSTDLRGRVLAAVEAGESPDAAARRFAVARMPHSASYRMGLSSDICGPPVGPGLAGERPGDAVRDGAGGLLRAGGAGHAGAVLDGHGSAQDLLQPRLKGAGDDVGAAARRPGDDQAQGLVRSRCVPLRTDEARRSIARCAVVALPAEP